MFDHSKLSQYRDVKIYIVGGYVRDRLLGLECNDHDFVVVGATPEEMIAAGFIPIEAISFPVFHHPITRDEFALARTEKKTGSGYHSFEVVADPNVTLYEDLYRRDITMNAMAREVISWNELGHAKLSDVIIDPYGGRIALQSGVIRHIGDAFKEDPVRVLRVARFAARYGFTVDPDTIELMRQLVNSGELNYLTPERVWIELVKAIKEVHPMTFFQVLDECGAKNVLFPEFERTLISSGWALTRAALYDMNFHIRLLLLFSYMTWDKTSVMLTRLKAPTDVQRKIQKLQTMLVALQQEKAVNWDITPEHILDLFKRVDAFRQPSEVLQIGTAICFMAGDRLSRRMDKFLEVFREIYKIKFATLSSEQKKNLEGAEVGETIDRLKLDKIKEFFDPKY